MLGAWQLWFKRLAQVWMHWLDAEVVRGNTPMGRPHVVPGLLNALLYRRFIRGAPATVAAAQVDREVADGDLLPIGGGLQALHALGHSPGYLAFLLERNGGLLFAGDVCRNLPTLANSIVYDDRAEGRRSFSSLASLSFAASALGTGVYCVRPRRAASIASGQTHRLLTRSGLAALMLVDLISSGHLADVPTMSIHRRGSSGGVQTSMYTHNQRRFDRSLRLMHVTSWFVLLVLIGSVTVGLAAAAFMPCSGLAERGNDLRSEIALRVALLTAPGHDARRPTNVLASWTATLDHALERLPWRLLRTIVCAQEQPPRNIGSAVAALRAPL
jgi:hypothetical protein